MDVILAQLGYIILGLIIGGGLGWFFTKRALEKQLRDNPPVNERMIRAMFMQMGRKPSEKQVRQVMNQMNQQKNQK